MKILYVAPLRLGNTSLHRLQALKELGHELIGLDTTPVWARYLSEQAWFLRGVLYRLCWWPESVRINQQVQRGVKENQVDVLWIDKELTIWPGTLRKVRQISPGTRIVGYSPDDMAARHNQGRNFLRCLPFYHIFLVTRLPNVQELTDFGAPRVIRINFAYDLHAHRPMQLSPEERRRFGGPVGFIGCYERARAEALFFLARNGIPVRIWGAPWKWQCRHRHPGLKIEGVSLLGDDYARGICAFDINLGFLNKMNRDLQTTRSFEIPACGAFMLAERTEEHLELFEEGKEAEFFGSNQELLEKVGYYLKNAAARQAIARAGRERCLKSGYSNQERLRQILKLLES
jgi:spore maturation protein CgeB